MELAAGADRRILRAFYTQYVAVLLIVLTFTIGAFQRTSQVQDAVVTGQVRRDAPQIGTFNIEGALTPDGSVVSDNQQLQALVKVLEEHDLTASVVLSVSHLEFNQNASSLRRVFRKLTSLERFFEQHAIPASAIQFVAEESGEISDSITVRLFTEEGAR